MAKARIPMQVDPEFQALIKKMQEDYRRNSGKNKSMVDITKEIAKILDNQEKQLGIKFKVDKR